MITSQSVVIDVTAQNPFLSYPQQISFGMEINAYFSQNPQNPIVATQLSFGNISENLGPGPTGGGYPYPNWVAYAATDAAFTNIIAKTTLPANHDVQGQQYYTHSMTSQEFNAAALANALGLSGTTTTTAPIPIYVIIIDTVNDVKSNVVGISLAYYGPGSFQVGWTGWGFSGGFAWY